MGPLTAIMEANPEDLSYQTVVEATTAAVSLIGNATAKISYWGRKKATNAINKSLLLLVEEDSNFKDSPPLLFGTEFAKKCKELVGQVKAMQSSLVAKKDHKPLFRGGPSTRRGGGYAQTLWSGRRLPLPAPRVQAIPPEKSAVEPETPKMPTSTTKEQARCKHSSRSSYKYRYQCCKFCGKFCMEPNCWHGNRYVYINELPPSRKTGPLGNQLEVGYKGQVGSRCNTWISHRIHRSSLPKEATPPTILSFRTDRANPDGDQGASTKKGSHGVDQPTSRGVLLHPFSSSQKDGGQRPVINLKPLNQFVQQQHFKMEGIHTLRELIQPGDWLTKLDLKDAFFTIPIHHSHRHYLRFMFLEKVYEFNYLPFGLSSAPWVFTQTLKPVIALLRELGVRLIAYIDDNSCPGGVQITSRASH